MANKITFQVESRTVTGKGVKKLRAQMISPGNVLVPNEDSVLFQVKSQAVNKLYHEVGESGLFYVKIEGEKADRPVLFEDVQRQPVTQEILNVVLKQVNLKEKIKAEIAVEIIGENTVTDAMVQVVLDTIEVEALPADLPEKFEIDISTLTEIGQVVTFNDLSYDKSKVTLMVEAEEMSSPVVMLQESKPQEEPAEETEAAEGEAPAAEGDAEAPSEEKTEASNEE
jgi:large subunit ribosomal protein L25